MSAVCTWMTALALLAGGPVDVAPAPTAAAEPDVEAPVDPSAVQEPPSDEPEDEPSSPDADPHAQDPATDDPAEGTDPDAPPADDPPVDGHVTADPFADPPPSDSSTAAPAQDARAPTTDASIDDEEFADEPFDADYDPMRDSPEAIAATRRVRTGIALLSVGGALLVGATVFGTLDPCRRGVGNSCQEEASRRAALTMALPGIAFVVGGAVSLGLGLKRRQALRASVTAGRDGGGIVVVGRF